MKYVTAAIAFALLLSGCATSKAVQGPSGGVAYFIKCGSAVVDACHEEAAKVCPRGYTFADKQINPNGVAMPVGTGFAMVRGPNSMLVECKS